MRFALLSTSSSSSMSASCVQMKIPWLYLLLILFRSIASLDPLAQSKRISLSKSLFGTEMTTFLGVFKHRYWENTAIKTDLPHPHGHSVMINLEGLASIKNIMAF